MVVNAHNMRIHMRKVHPMQVSAQAGRKRPVNLTLSEALVDEARSYTPNLSATIESLLTEFVANQQSAERERQRAADACADGWNAVHASVGSFADEHSTL